jgi:hypothetical protein
MISGGSWTLARDGLEGSVFVSGWFSCVGESWVCVDKVERAIVKFLLFREDG